MAFMWRGGILSWEHAMEKALTDVCSTIQCLYCE